MTVSSSMGIMELALVFLLHFGVGVLCNREPEDA